MPLHREDLTGANYSCPFARGNNFGGYPFGSEGFLDSYNLDSDAPIPGPSRPRGWSLSPSPEGYTGQSGDLGGSGNQVVASYALYPGSSDISELGHYRPQYLLPVLMVASGANGWPEHAGRVATIPAEFAGPTVRGVAGPAPLTICPAILIPLGHSRYSQRTTSCSTLALLL